MISCWGNAFTGSNRGDHCEEDYDSNGEGFDLSGNKNKRQKHHYIGAAFTSDNLLAAELTSLSFQEREQVYEELHGVDEADHHLKIETPDFVTAKVQQMQDAVAKQPQQRRREYDRAMFLNPTLKNDQTFFLLFLRAEEYDAMLAAKRICAHFTDKVLLWGEDRVARRITLEDFDDKDLYSLRSGAFRYLESKDRAGRTVLYGRADLMRHDTWISHVRFVVLLVCMHSCIQSGISLTHMPFSFIRLTLLAEPNVVVLAHVLHFGRPRQSCSRLCDCNGRNAVGSRKGSHVGRRQCQRWTHF